MMITRETEDCDIGPPSPPFDTSANDANNYEEVGPRWVLLMNEGVKNFQVIPQFEPWIWLKYMRDIKQWAAVFP